MVRIVGFRCDDGSVQPLAWTNDHVSKSELRRITRKFKADSDFVKPCLLGWRSLYSSKAEARSELPRY